MAENLIINNKVDWEMFENIIRNNPDKYMGELFTLYEKKIMFSRENIDEYNRHLNAAISKIL